VRTPMQWEPGPTAGFSTASPSSLYLPIVAAPGYGPEAVNVAAQREDPGSLLNWTRSMLALRKRYPEFGTAPFEQVPASDPAVFSFLRRGARDLLVTANFAAGERTATLDLDAVAGRVPVDLRSGDRLPPIGPGGHEVTLGPHRWRWLELAPAG